MENFASPNLEYPDDTFIGSVISESEHEMTFSFAQPNDENFLDIMPIGNRIHFNDKIHVHSNWAISLSEHYKDWTIPGRGVGWSDCKQIRTDAIYISPNNEVRFKRHSCHLQGCPDCFRIWAYKQAKRTGDFLVQVAANYKRVLSHWTFTTNVFKSWDQLENKLWEFFEEFGVDKKELMVSIVRHPFSIRCRGCHQPSGAYRDDRGFIKYRSVGTHRLKKNCEICGLDFPWQWEFSPHLHIITDFQYQMNEVDKFVECTKKTKSFFKRIHRWDYRYILDDWNKNHLLSPSKSELRLHYKKIVRRVIAYEFGHSLVEGNQQHPVIRHFGSASPMRVRLDLSKKIRTPVLDSKGQPFSLICADKVEVIGEDTCKICKVQSNIDGKWYLPYEKNPKSFKNIWLQEIENEYEVVQLVAWSETFQRYRRIVNSRVKDKEIKKAYLHHEYRSDEKFTDLLDYFL